MVKNEVAIQYHGVTVYHAHKANSIAESTSEYVFSTDPYGRESDVGNDNTFDVRQLKSYDKELTALQNVLKAIIEGEIQHTTENKQGNMNPEYVHANNGADEHHCPVCGFNLEDTDEEIWRDSGIGTGNNYEYCGGCPHCGAEFVQVYRMVFDGYSVK